MKTRMTTTVLSLSALAAAALVSAPASAAITGVFGATTQVFTPATCVPGGLQSFNAFAWDEVQSRTIINFPVDMVNNPGASSAPIAGTISGVVDSHFIHFDGFPGVISATGSVTFNNPIVGVNFFNASLDATDGLFGDPGTTYPTFFPFRDLTTNNSGFNIVGNTINFNLSNFSPVGGVVQIRVFTQVPAPGAAGVAGLLGAAMLRRRRRSN
jgi:uncharacterized protein (TIGR03382 family)